jgi:hypothetical protein
MQFNSTQINNFSEISEDILEVFSDLELHDSIDFRVGGEWIIYFKNGGAYYLSDPKEINSRIERKTAGALGSTRTIRERGFKLVYRISLSFGVDRAVPVQMISGITSRYIDRVRSAQPIAEFVDVMTYEPIGDRGSIERAYSPEDWKDKTKLSQYGSGGYKKIVGVNFYFQIWEDPIVNIDTYKDEIWDILSSLELEFKGVDLFSWKSKEDKILYQFELNPKPSLDELTDIFKTLESLIHQSEKMTPMKFKEIEILHNFHGKSSVIKSWPSWLYLSRSLRYDDPVGVKQFNIIFEI